MHSRNTLDPLRRPGCGCLLWNGKAGARSTDRPSTTTTVNRMAQRKIGRAMSMLIPEVFAATHYLRDGPQADIQAPPTAGLVDGAARNLLPRLTIQTL